MAILRAICDTKIKHIHQKNVFLFQILRNHKKWFPLISMAYALFRYSFQIMLCIGKVELTILLFS